MAHNEFAGLYVRQGDVRLRTVDVHDNSDGVVLVAGASAFIQSGTHLFKNKGTRLFVRDSGAVTFRGGDGLTSFGAFLEDNGTNPVFIDLLLHQAGVAHFRGTNTVENIVCDDAARVFVSGVLNVTSNTCP